MNVYIHSIDQLIKVFPPYSLYPRLLQAAITSERQLSVQVYGEIYQMGVSDFFDVVPLVIHYVCVTNNVYHIMSHST